MKVCICWQVDGKPMKFVDMDWPYPVLPRMDDFFALKQIVKDVNKEDAGYSWVVDLISWEVCRDSGEIFPRLTLRNEHDEAYSATLKDH